MSKHEQGPWKTNGETIFSSYDLIITYVGGGSLPKETNEANAYLMAASPEMLAMLYRVVSLLNDPDADDVDALRMEREIEQVIAKATGQEV